MIRIMMHRALILLFTLLLSFVSISGSAEANSKYASIIIDASSGTVLEQQYADKRLHPASLTKIMTLLVLFEALEGGRIDLNDRIRVSRHAASMVPSKLGLKPGSSIRVKDAIYALAIKSANDVAVAVAERLGGTERGFANIMNRKARQIGMNRTHFRNASGLHDKRQISTARDMAKLARYVIQAYPSYYRYYSRKSFSYGGKTYRSHNRLMGKYKGMDGMKTGYIAASGFNLVASAVRNDRRIIAVVFGGRSSKSRNAHMEVLLDRGFVKMNDIRIARAEVPLPPRKPAVLAAVAVLNKAGEAMPQKVASVGTDLQGGFNALIGEGDFDPRMARRIETGLIAISAHRNQKKHSDVSSSSYKKMNVAVIAPSAHKNVLTSYNKNEPWSVQIGAFNSRVASDKVVQGALRQLPKPYSNAQPAIAPLKTADGWLFRARLTGFTKQEAYGACQFLKDCLPVAPRN